MKKRHHIALAGKLILCAASCLAQVHISGRVVRQNGQPVADATVAIFPLEVAVEHRFPMTSTDEQGLYKLEVPPYGKVRISAYKTSEGFPDKQALLFANGDEKFVELRLVSGGNFPNTDIEIGKPYGVISGTVVDTYTSSIVPQARVTLTRADSPDVMYSSYLDNVGSFSFPLPHRAITISVSAPGYETWTFRDPDTGTAFAMVNEGDNKKVEIRLEPANRR